MPSPRSKVRARALARSFAVWQVHGLSCPRSRGHGRESPLPRSPLFGSSCEIPTDGLGRKSVVFRERENRMVSLDSSFLIDLLAGEPRAVARAAELDRASEPRFLTSPAASEVLIGGYRLGGAYLERTKALVDGLPLLAFDRACYHQAGRLGAELLKRGTPLGQGDLFVAAISIRYGERLLTNDRGFSRVPGLVVETY